MRSIVSRVAVAFLAVVVFTAGFAIATAASSSRITVTSQTKNVTWKKGTGQQMITWSYSGISSGQWVNNQNIPSVVEISLAAATSSATRTTLATGVAIGERKYVVSLEKIDGLAEGTYNVVINYGGNTVVGVSKGKVTVVKADDPKITITSPSADAKWTTGSMRKVTWVTNFMARQRNIKVGRFGDVIVVPLYGVGVDVKSLDLSKFSKEDKDKIEKLSAEDLTKLLNAADKDLEDLTPGSVNIPNVSSSGLKQLSRLSDDGLDLLKKTTPGGSALDNFANDAVMKTFELQTEIDPLFNALFGGLFGSSKKPKTVLTYVQAIAVDDNGKLLDKSYTLATTDLERGQAQVSLNGVAVGKYKIRVSAKLRDTEVTTLSPVIEVVAKSDKPKTDAPDKGENKKTSIDLSNPGAGKTYVAGKTVRIKWSSTNLDKDTLIHLSLLEKGNEFHSQINSDGKPVFVGDKYYEWNIPANFVSPGTSAAFKVRITCARVNEPYVPCESTTGVFTVNPSETSNSSTSGNSSSSSGSSSSGGTTVSYPSVPINPSYVCAADGKSATLKWGQSSGAVAYVVHVNKGANNYGTAAYKDTGITGTSHVYRNMTPGTSYTWWVAARNADGRLSQGSIGGVFSCTASVSTMPTAPTLSFTTDSTSLQYNVATNVRWSGSGVSSCSLAKNGTTIANNLSSSGSRATDPTTANTTYTLTCTGAGGSISKSVSIALAPAPEVVNQIPIGNFGNQSCDGITGWAYDPNHKGSAISVKIFEGTKADGTTLALMSTDRQRDEINNQYGLTGTHGFYFTIPASMKDGKAHTINAYALDKETNVAYLLNGSPKIVQCGTATVSNTTPAAPTQPTPATPTLTFTTDSTSLQYNVATNVRWSGSGVSSCSLAKNGTTIANNLSSSGSRATDPTTANTTYTLTCTGAGGSISKSVSIALAPAPAPAPEPTNYLPKGNFGTQTCSTITGWAFDPNNTASQVTVRIYEGPNTNKKLIVAMGTDRQRDDVNQAHNLTGPHGFLFTIPSSLKTGTNRSVYAYAIDKQSGEEILLPGSPKTVNCQLSAAQEKTQTATVIKFSTLLSALGSLFGF